MAMPCVSSFCTAASPSTTARLIRFSSSRTLPGQSYSVSSFSVSGEPSASGLLYARVLLQEEIGEQRNLVAPVAQRRHLNADHVQPEEQVLAECPVATDCSRSRLVAAMIRTSTWTSCLPPRRENSPSCSTCRSLACSGGLISLISSRKIVPCGELELAGLVLNGAGEGAALVAEQLRSRAARPAAPRSSPSRTAVARASADQIARATNSLPMPLSPGRAR